MVLAGKVYNYGCNLSPSSWTWSLSPKSNGFGKLGEEMLGSSVAGGAIVSNSHCSTVERLYAWEKKLYQEVKVKFEFKASNFQSFCMIHCSLIAQENKIKKFLCFPCGLVIEFSFT